LAAFQSEKEMQYIRRAMRHMDVLLLLPDMSLRNSEVHAFSQNSPAPSLQIAPTHKVSIPMVCVAEMDTLDAGVELAAAGLQPALLNMANEFNCGGQWCHARGSQEEHLMRSSSLPLSLWPLRRTDDTRLPEYDAKLPRAAGGPCYPWSEACVVYSPNVLVTSLKSRPRVAVLSIAAQDLRCRTAHYKASFDVALTGEKVRSALWAARSHGHESLVLGALGCGAFCNDPSAVARVFAGLLTSGGEFEGVFSVVVFAIIKSPSSVHAFSQFFPVEAHLGDALKARPGAAELAAAATAAKEGEQAAAIQTALSLAGASSVDDSAHAGSGRRRVLFEAGL